MSGLHGQLLGHLVKRGIEHVSAVPVESNSNAYAHELQMKTEGYEAWLEKHGNPSELIVLFLTCIFFIFAYASVKYTLGEVVASLAMIEQPRSLIVSEISSATDKRDSYTPNEKDGLLDEEVSVYYEKSITASIRFTIRHLTQVGGWAARWRGLAISFAYHAMQAILGQLLSAAFSSLTVSATLAHIIGSVLSSVLLARIHMTWTHIMISPPSALPWYKRVPHGRTYFKALITPTLIFCLAQHLTVFLPMVVYLSFGMFDDGSDLSVVTAEQNDVFRVLATLATAAFVGLALLLPASVTLTRVEASLMPDDTETIVHFDRTLGGAAINLAGFSRINFRALYDAAWRSFDRTSRIRLIKFYVKYFAIIMFLFVSFFVVIAAEMAAFETLRTFVFMHGANAQAQLAGAQ